MYNRINPTYITPYNIPKNIVKRKTDDEKSPASQNQNMQENSNNNNSIQKYSPSNSFVLSGYRTFNQSQIQDNNKQTVNIAQIVGDFKNTTAAVGAPENITDEIYSYLGLIEIQAQKPNPNKKLIQSNLKNASQVLDGYITDTLKKPSKVVENWIDALFLQNIDYKSNPNAINKDFKIDLPEAPQRTSTQPISNVQVQAENKLQPIEVNTKSPEQEQMEFLFKKSKEDVQKESPLVALRSLKAALDYSYEINDTNMQAEIYYTTADFYNKREMLPEALAGYNTSTKISDNSDLIAKSYIKMGRIYDKSNLEKSAKDYYFSAVAYAGDADNLPVQVKALQNLASISTRRYKERSATELTNLANSLADSTKDDKVIAYSYKKSSKVNSTFNNNVKAMSDIQKSTMAYNNLNDTYNMVKNYISAAEIMIEVGNSSKAKILLTRAFNIAAQNDYDELLSDISTKISKLA